MISSERHHIIITMIIAAGMVVIKWIVATTSITSTTMAARKDIGRNRNVIAVIGKRDARYGIRDEVSQIRDLSGMTKTLTTLHHGSRIPYQLLVIIYTKSHPYQHFTLRAFTKDIKTIRTAGTIRTNPRYSWLFLRQRGYNETVASFRNIDRFRNCKTGW